MSKIFAITSSGKTEKSYLDLRFGKCEFLVLFDVEKNQYSIEENPFIGESHSGIKLVDFLKNMVLPPLLQEKWDRWLANVLKKKSCNLFYCTKNAFVLTKLWIALATNKVPGLKKALTPIQLPVCKVRFCLFYYWLAVRPHRFFASNFPV